METSGLPFGSSKLQFHLESLVQSPTVSSFFQNLKPSTVTDGLAVFLFLLVIVSYLGRGRIWDQPDSHYYVYFERPQVAQAPGRQSDRPSINRSISQTLENHEYDCVIFWGSQSGTAERYAGILGRECLSYFGVKALVADLSDFDAESIASIQRSHFAVFLLSTYGEGDPSDNAAGLWDWIRQMNDKNIKVENLRYLAFGLGNSNYKYYNRVLDVVADAFDAAGATALIPRQKADDANGGTEEDFQAWKDTLFELFRTMGYKERATTYQPNIDVTFTGEAITQDASSIEVVPYHQQSTTNSAIMTFDIKNTRELFVGGDRNCVHMELSPSNDNLVGYKTGDHIGIWPCNPEEEVDLLLSALGLQERRYQYFTVTAQSDSLKTKVPSPTTPDTLFRNHLEICSPVTRKTTMELARFAPTPEAKSMLLTLSHDRDNYGQLAASAHITLARLLKLVSPDVSWSSLPLSFVIENVLALQPRYYSISSSSVIAPRQIAITALVINTTLPGAPTPTAVPGLTSNYLLSASGTASKAGTPTPTYQHLSEPGNPQSTKISAHIRKSKFKLPVASSTPLVLVGAGTGLAPLRAFLHERAKLSSLGKPIGKILLFFGCRNHDDFIYREEIEKIQAQLGEQLEVITAFSRSDRGEKVYVQDQIAGNATKVIDMLDAGANMYICGKANMAREVDRKLEEAVVQSKGLPETDAKAWFEGLKRRGKWRADVWG